MTVLLKLPILIIFAAIFTLHVLSFALHNIIAKIAVFVNIALHIAMFVTLSFLGATMAETTLAFMISLLFYLACALAFYKLSGRERQ